jgi:hypothetical protein
MDGLLVSHHAEQRLIEARSELGHFPSERTIPDGWFDHLATALGASLETHPALERHLGLRSVEGHHVVWRGSLADKATAVLAACGRPLAMLEIHELVGFDANPRSLAGQVQEDPRIMRRGKDLYGLRVWGGEEYSGIVEELEQAIERSPDGRIDLAETAELFVEQFGVSANSVRSYANDRRFVRESDGSLRLRDNSDPEPDFRPQAPDATPGLFLLDGRWHLRVELDGELLRGSGRATRNGVALAAGLEPGLMVGFDYEGNSVTFSWRGKQPAIGSVRGVAQAHGCTVGDLLFLPLDGPEPRRSRVVRSAELARASGGTRLALAMGLSDGEGADSDTPGPVARALGLPAGADWSDVVDRLHDRGEAGLLELVPSWWR